MGFRTIEISHAAEIHIKEMNQMFPKRKIKYTDENVKKRMQRFFEKNENVPTKCDLIIIEEAVMIHSFRTFLLFMNNLAAEARLERGVFLCLNMKIK